MSKYERFVRAMAKRHCDRNPHQYTFADGVVYSCLTEVFPKSIGPCDSCSAKICVGLRGETRRTYEEQQRNAAKLRRQRERELGFGKGR